MTEPGHIIRQPGDRNALCGERDILPVTWALYVQAHIDGHAPAWCEKCFAVWAGLPPKDRTPPATAPELIVPRQGAFS